MAHVPLHGAEVDAGCEQMRGRAPAQRLAPAVAFAAVRPLCGRGRWLERTRSPHRGSVLVSVPRVCRGPLESVGCVERSVRNLGDPRHSWLGQVCPSDHKEDGKGWRGSRITS